MAVDEKIVERIQKLEALSTSSNPNEAASALAMMQALLQKYNLDMAEVQMKTGKKSDYLRTFLDLVNRDDWRRKLLGVLADHMFCTSLIRRYRGYTQGILIGEKENIETVTFLFSLVQEQLEKMATKELEAYRKSGGLVHARKWKINFYMGALYTIKKRLDEEQKAFEASKNECKALIVLKDKDLQEAVQTMYPKVSPNYYARKYTTVDGWKEGKEAGKEVILHKQERLS